MLVFPSYFIIENGSFYILFLLTVLRLKYRMFRFKRDIDGHFSEIQEFGGPD